MCSSYLLNTIYPEVQASKPWCLNFDISFKKYAEVVCNKIIYSGESPF